MYYKVYKSAKYIIIHQSISTFNPLRQECQTMKLRERIKCPERIIAHASASSAKSALYPTRAHQVPRAHYSLRESIKCQERIIARASASSAQAHYNLRERIECLERIIACASASSARAHYSLRERIRWPERIITCASASGGQSAL